MDINYNWLCAPNQLQIWPSSIWLQRGFYFWSLSPDTQSSIVAILTPVDQAPAGQTTEKGQSVPARPPSSTEFLTWNLHNAWGQERVGGSAEHFPGEYSPAVQRWVWLWNGNRNKWCFRFYFSAREPHRTGMLKYTDVCYFCSICWEAESAITDFFFLLSSIFFFYLKVDWHISSDIENKKQSHYPNYVDK